MTAFALRSAALDTASVMPRSLNDPVGLAPSILRKTCATPARDASRGASRSGVLPSRRVITGVASLTGSRSRNAPMTPGQASLIAGSPDVAGDAQHRPDPAHPLSLAPRLQPGAPSRLPA